MKYILSNKENFSGALVQLYANDERYIPYYNSPPQLFVWNNSTRNVNWMYPRDYIYDYYSYPYYLQ